MLILGGKVFQVIRKIYVTILSVVVAVFLLVGCGQANNARTRDKQAPDVSSQGQQLVQDSESAGQERVEDVQDKDHESAGEADGDFPSVQEPPAEDGDLPVVYMTTEISAESLMAVYEALGASPSGRIAVKLSTGEPGSNYLRTDLIGDFVMSFEDPTIVECNTAYGGSRANTAMHYQVAEDHGYAAIADVDIMDENGSMTLPVEGGDNLTENYVGAKFLKNFGRNLKATGGWFFMGNVLSALFQWYVPADVMTDLFGGNQAFGRDEHGKCGRIYDHRAGQYVSLFLKRTPAALLHNRGSLTIWRNRKICSYLFWTYIMFGK